jgi:hypothetical protein
MLASPRSIEFACLPIGTDRFPSMCQPRTDASFIVATPQAIAIIRNQGCRSNYKTTFPFYICLQYQGAALAIILSLGNTIYCGEVGHVSQ